MTETLHTFAHRAMATTFEAKLFHADAVYAAAAAQAVFARIDAIEESLSRYRAASDISRVNQSEPGTWVVVSPDAQACLRAALQLHRDTGGIFDPAFRTPGAMAGLRVDDKIPQVMSSQSIDLDLGGIGKGFALDEAASLLSEWDITRALLQAGGSTVLAMDPPPGSEGWIAGVGKGKSIALVRQSLSASGTSVRGHHLIDPASGQPPATDHRTWALAPTATESDALSTAFFLMSRDAIITYCQIHPGTAARRAGPHLQFIDMLPT